MKHIRRLVAASAIACASFASAATPQLARVLVACIAGVPQLVTVSDEGVVRRFAGWPLVEERTLELDLEDFTAAIGDIGADGELDRVTSGTSWQRATGLAVHKVGASTHLVGGSKNGGRITSMPIRLLVSEPDPVFL